MKKNSDGTHTKCARRGEIWQALRVNHGPRRETESERSSFQPAAERDGLGSWRGRARRRGSGRPDGPLQGCACTSESLICLLSHVARAAIWGRALGINCRVSDRTLCISAS